MGTRYEFLVLPMGFSAWMGNFSEHLRSVLRGTGALVYVDDVLIGNGDPYSHDQALDRVLSTFNKYHIHLNPVKVQVGVEKLTFLGFDIENGQYHMTSYIEEQCHNLPKATTLS